MRTSFIDVLTNRVEIPIIQRDYAQGRTDNKTNKIRNEFLDFVFDFLQEHINEENNLEKELDFIYGFNKVEENQKFVPIDGQQRLTTLWLLYWYVSVKEIVEVSETEFLQNFQYETRHSTTQFCQNLTAFRPKFEDNNIVEEIKDQSWYFETWEYDPSIQAMLVMLSDIEGRYKALDNHSIWLKLKGDACPFYFYKLDMDAVGLSDDLYIKMNSRGKGLTEFEYFKAGFLEILSEKNKVEFEEKIDGKWIETIWSIVFKAKNDKKISDIALAVDSSFLNLFDFITSIIGYKKELKDDLGNRYVDTEISPEILKTIYKEKENQIFLIDTLNGICEFQEQNADFWESVFYNDQNDFDLKKSRLFFQHEDVNLLKRCLFQYSEYQGFTFPEQLIFYACLLHFQSPVLDFADKIRVVRNVAINSDSQLRQQRMGKAFQEIEKYLATGDISHLKTFRTYQIEEEKSKKAFILENGDLKEALHKLEDSDIFRGSISLIPFDDEFSARADMFLQRFDENTFSKSFVTKANLILCFGDYSQENGRLTNMMPPNLAGIRQFLTHPGFNEEHFYSRTQAVILDCLDFLVDNPDLSDQEVVNDSTVEIEDENGFYWKYYFLKYPSFRDNSTKGYFCWRDENLLIWKMRVTQFNGYHWDPFLIEVGHQFEWQNLSMENYASDLFLKKGNKTIAIESLTNGFQFKNGMTIPHNSLLEGLINDKTLDKDGILVIPQNDEGNDLEDRIENLVDVIKNILDS